jgi:hypothetical protein
MHRVLIAASACTVLVVVACEKSPTEKQAQALSDSGRSRASEVREGAKAEADALDLRASNLTAKAKAAGGYTGERLAVQARAAADEASIVRKQGRVQAQSIEEAGDAEAKAVRSR